MLEQTAASILHFVPLATRPVIATKEEADCISPPILSSLPLKSASVPTFRYPPHARVGNLLSLPITKFQPDID